MSDQQLKTMPAKRGRGITYDFSHVTTAGHEFLIDFPGGYYHPQVAKEELGKIRSAAFMWAKREGIKIRTEERVDSKTGEKVGLKVYLKNIKA